MKYMQRWLRVSTRAPLGLTNATSAGSPARPARESGRDAHRWSSWQHPGRSAQVERPTTGIGGRSAAATQLRPPTLRRRRTSTRMPAPAWTRVRSTARRGGRRMLDIRSPRSDLDRALQKATRCRQREPCPRAEHGVLVDGLLSLSGRDARGREIRRVADSRDLADKPPAVAIAPRRWR